MKKIFLISLLFLIVLHTNVTAQSDYDRVALSRDTNEIFCIAGVNTFDVDTNGNIALGLYNDRILIYDEKGTFQYAYDFSIGGGYSFQYNELGGISLLDVRYGLLYKFDSNDELILVERGDYYELFNDWNRNEVIKNDCSYRLRKGIFRESVIKENDYSKIVFSTPIETFRLRIAIFISVVVVILFIIFMVVLKWRKQKVQPKFSRS